MKSPKEAKWIDMVAGVKRRTLVSGKTMMQMQVMLESGSHLPEHYHPHEQIAHVVSGRWRLTVESKPHDLRPGESFYLVSNIPHSADALEDTVVIDTFSPPREGFAGAGSFVVHTPPGMMGVSILPILLQQLVA